MFFETIKTILSIVLEKTIDVLPHWISHRIISPQKIANQIEIDLRSSKPIDISFGTEIPRLSIYFRISNLSSHDIMLDRLLFDFWVGQPTLRGAILEKIGIPKRSSKDNIFFTNQLSVPQQEQIRKKINDKILSVPITININAYFDCKIGVVNVKKNFEYRDLIFN